MKLDVAMRSEATSRVPSKWFDWPGASQARSRLRSPHLDSLAYRRPRSLLAPSEQDVAERSEATSRVEVERGTGFEPATTSLEGWCSATELPPRDLGPSRSLMSSRADFFQNTGEVCASLVNRQLTRPSRGCLHCTRPPQRSCGAESKWWAGRDSNPRRREPTDLQSAPFGRLGTCPPRGSRPQAPGFGDGAAA